VERKPKFLKPLGTPEVGVGVGVVLQVLVAQELLLKALQGGKAMAALTTPITWLQAAVAARVRLGKMHPLPQLAAMAATDFNRLLMARLLTTLAGAGAGICLTPEPLTLSVALVVAQIAALVAWQTQAAAAVAVEVKQAAQPQAAPASSSSVTHSVWHKDFK
jgi:prepilin signal peptidase PulO-like enzyme (type II secretory pathway)